MAKVTFLFDIIVTRLKLSMPEITMPESLLVKLKFNDNALIISASRINVSEFQENRGIECKAVPQDLRNNLERSGVTLTLVYCGIMVGTAKVTFSQSFIDRIDNGMNDSVYAESCPIIRQDEQVGTLEVLCYLTIKCDEDELELNEEPENDIKNCNEMCVNLGKNINEADMLFVVSAPKPCPIPCPLPLEELQPEEGDERLELDLDRYRSVNQRLSEPPEIMCGSKVCLPLKILTKQCADFIDAVVDRVNELPSPMSIRDSLFMRNESESYQQPGMERTIPIPVNDMVLKSVKPIRFCPYCLTPMSWLPKYASCHRCSAKVMPPLDIFDEKLTADQIIQQTIKANPYDENESSNEANSKKSKKSGRCCCCEKGVMCAHCRVLNACGDIFKPECQLKVDKNKSEIEDYRIIVKPEKDPTSKCRPYLERVFSELQLLYRKSDEKKLNVTNKYCTRPLLEGQTSPKTQSITSL